jgi:hypothetical protein
MLRVYEIIFGAQLGLRAKKVVMKLWDQWVNKDPQFLRIKEAFHNANNSVYGFVETCILPKFHVWVGQFWKFMNGSANVEHAVTLAEAFSEVRLAQDHFYITLAVFIQQMSNQPVTQAAAQSSQVTQADGAAASAAALAGAGGGAQAGDDGKFVINGKVQCPDCSEKEQKFPLSHHPVSDCHTLKKEIAKKKNGGGKGGEGGKGRGGGRRGRRGGKRQTR